MNSDEIHRWLEQRLHEQLRVPLPIDPHARLDELGLDSMEAVGFTGELEALLGCRVDPTALWDHPTLHELAAHLESVSRSQVAPLDASELPAFTQRTYDQFLYSQSPEHAAAARFSEWVDSMKKAGVYGFEAARKTAQRSRVEVEREDGVQLHMLNFSSYNYLGFGVHPTVIQSAKDALDRYGLGAASSPVVGGTNMLHRQLERELVDFLGVPDRDATLFSSGYAVNTGTLSAFVHQGHHVVLDRNAHVSLLEGAQLARADTHYFKHNDPEDLARVLGRITERGRPSRIVVATEGVFSADGDFGALAEIAAVCRAHGAHLLVDEAHSILVSGPNGRGVAAMQGVLDQVDLFVITFSKGFGAVGGALVARPEIVQYINWYARCRMFSCALDPAVTGGILAGLRLGSGAEGDVRRARLLANATHLRDRLRGHVQLGRAESWIVPVHFGDERLTILLGDHLQRAGLDTSIMQFPAVLKGESRIRLFVTSEHTREDLDRCADIIVEAAHRFGFSQTEGTDA